jgi:hypothetical protein
MGCLADAGVVDRLAYGLADRTPAAHARRPAPLVLDDRAGRHRPDLVEHPERQGDTFVPDSEAPVRVIHHLDLLVGEPVREGRRIQQKHHPVVAQREIAGDPPLLAPSQDLVFYVGHHVNLTRIQRVQTCLIFWSVRAQL